MTTDPSLSPDAVRPRPRGRGVYLLPNLFTTAVLFSGFYAIVAATDGNFDRAGIAIFIALVCDGLDGRIARWTNTQSEFGKEYDSLSDMVAFGLAPAMVAYQWGVARIAEYEALWGRLAGFRHVLLRPARHSPRAFNARAAGADKRYFEGCPVRRVRRCWPASLDARRPRSARACALILAFAVALIAGGLMVSWFAYLSGKDFNLNKRIPFAVLLLVPLGSSSWVRSPPEISSGCLPCMRCPARRCGSGTASRAAAGPRGTRTPARRSSGTTNAGPAQARESRGARHRRVRAARSAAPGAARHRRRRPDQRGDDRDAGRLGATA
jgi:CDP-diacylglycerol--serine O-phosphatidyltransferase